MLRVPRLPSALAILLLMPLLVLVGCLKGDTGPAGLPGADGDDGVLYEWTYIGDNGAGCKHCHEGLVADVGTTAHTHAYDDLDAEDKANPYCLKCHTTGWDSDVNYGETEIAVYGPDLFGYDDYFGVAGDEAAARRASLEGVQCESCHGPGGPNTLQFTPAISFATRFEGDESLSLCAKCHTTQVDEWADAGHAFHGEMLIEDFNAEHYAGSSSCQPCHTSEGFIFANDPAYADYELPEDHLYSFIGCVTCHDPHVGTDGGGNDMQLRNLGDVEVEYHPGFEDGDEGLPTMSGFGNGQICAQCHHARRDTDNVLGQIAEGYGHFGPHGSPQMDMYIGAGCYEIEGFTYESTHTHNTAIVNACVKCHMVREAEIHGEMQEHSFHTFQPDVGNCAMCHPSLTEFADAWNPLNGPTAQELMDTLAARFGFADVAAFMDDGLGWDNEEVGVEPWMREVAYALVFVYNDGSEGAHNPAYARTLLENAIAHWDANVLTP